MFAMRTAQDLAPDELVTIVAALQQALYLDFDTGPTPVWNPDKQWEGAEICDQLAAELARFDLVPSVISPVSPDAP
jgi:hypothetical protein